MDQIPMKKLFKITLLLVSLFAFLLPVIPANAGGGCGSSIPKISRSLVGPGESFYVEFSFIQYDSDINYADPSVAPEVNFSSSIDFLRKKMSFIELDSNKWGLYKATFKVPDDFIGNQNLQAVITYPRCEGKTRNITFGPQVTIQSNNLISTCIIEDLQVSDYSVRSGEPFKVGFKVYSSLQDLNPVIELTDYLGTKKFIPRLAGKSGSDLKIYEATLEYSQNYQFPYGAIARAEITGFCNSSGQRQVIGTSGYITSQALIQPIYPGSSCEIEGSKILTTTDSAVSEELVCAKEPSRANTLKWFNTSMLAKLQPRDAKQEPCFKAYAAKTSANQKTYCILRTNGLMWIPEKEINMEVRQELREIQNSKNATFVKTVSKAIKSRPEIISNLNNLLDEYNQSISNVPESMKESVEEFVYLDFQFESYVNRLNTLLTSGTRDVLASGKIKTITCVKGKTVKKISANNPKCPSGYKKK